MLQPNFPLQNRISADLPWVNFSPCCSSVRASCRVSHYAATSEARFVPTPIRDGGDRPVIHVEDFRTSNRAAELCHLVATPVLKLNSTQFLLYSSHLLLRRHTPWLHPARATTAAAAMQAGTSSAKPTCTSEACPLPPRTMTWSSSVSRE